MLTLHQSDKGESESGKASVLPNQKFFLSFKHRSYIFKLYNLLGWGKIKYWHIHQTYLSKGKLSLCFIVIFRVTMKYNVNIAVATQHNTHYVLWVQNHHVLMNF